MRKSLHITFSGKRNYLLLLAATTLCLFVPAQFLYFRTTSVLKDNARMRALSIATTVATFLEDDIEVYRAIADASDLEKTPRLYADYQRYNGLLRTIKEQSEAHFVYTEAFVDDTTIRYILDAEMPDSDLFSPFGSLDEMDETEQIAYTTRTAAGSRDLISSDWGVFLSAFAPIIDARDGSLAGLVGVDYSAATLLIQSRKLLYLHIITFSVLSLLLSFSLYVVIQLISVRAYTDELTGLGNRRAMNKTMGRLEREARRRGKAFVLLTLDVDAFKPINDEHGHPVGDKVLVRIAETLLQHSDWEEGCFRSGGDEFAMLLPCGDLEQAQQISRQIESDIQAVFLPELKGQALSVSIGTAMWQEGDSLETLVKRSDASLYEMKKHQTTRKKG